MFLSKSVFNLLALPFTLLFFSSICFAMDEQTGINDPDQELNEARKFQAFPIILRLDGVGEIYGAAVGLKGLGKRAFNVHLGASTGDVEASVFSISEFDLKRSKLNYQFLNLGELNLETQYGRNTQGGLLFKQELSGSAHHIGFQREARREYFSSSFDLVFSDISFEEFRDADGKVIPINMDGLTDVSSTIISLAVNYDDREKQVFSEGHQLKNALVFTTGREGQADQGVWNFQASKHLFLDEDLLVSVWLSGSHAFIVSEESAYDSDAEVRAQLDAQCSGLSGEEQIRCSELENSLVSFIVASNKYGTANAVGGGNGLRSYGEQFFRGANAWVQGAEFDYRLPAFERFNKKSRLHLIAFAESGQVNDKLSDLFDDSLHSVGLGLRAYAGDLALRLETAHGENGNAWNFRVGMPY